MLELIGKFFPRKNSFSRLLDSVGSAAPTDGYIWDAGVVHNLNSALLRQMHVLRIRCLWEHVVLYLSEGRDIRGGCSTGSCRAWILPGVEMHAQALSLSQVRNTKGGNRVKPKSSTHFRLVETLN